MKRLESLISKARKKGYAGVDWDEGISVSLDFEDKELIVYNSTEDRMRSCKLPKKESTLTPDWILKKIESFNSTYYKNLTNEMKKLGLKFGRLYPTSYGLGYVLLGQNAEEFKKEAKAIADFLEKKGYKFKNEFSERGWVYRFKIRQKQHRRLY